MATTRYAVVSLRRESVDVIERYLPDSYKVMGTTLKSDTFGSAAVIAGEDDHGWTLDDYVLPRLASGLITGYEILEEEAKRLLEAS